eukprot:6123455-Karenia_brevis.AAC.1
MELNLSIAFRFPNPDKGWQPVKEFGDDAQFRQPCNREPMRPPKARSTSLRPPRLRPQDSV